MAVHVQFLVSAFALAAVLGFAGRNAAGTEAMKARAVVRSSLVSERVVPGGTWTMAPVNLSAESAKSDRGFVASAKTRLDLSALTMADFGDVEPAR
jgi:hypothetical protein